MNAPKYVIIDDFENYTSVMSYIDRVNKDCSSQGTGFEWETWYVSIYDRWIVRVMI